MGRVLSRDQLLAHLRGSEEREIGARILDTAEAAIKREAPVNTDFLDPFAQTVSQGILGSIPEVSYQVFGGYPRAERKRLVVFPEYYLTQLVSDPIGALEITTDGFAASLSHRDYLGAIVGTGLSREKVGDILLTDGGAHVVVAQEITGFLGEALTHVGSVPVTVNEIDPEALEVEPERVREIRTTVASMRLDAIAASGFGTSRSKIVRMIKSDRIKVNWQSTTNPARTIEVGDVISMRGRGRVIVEEVTGTTKKGRFGVMLKRLS